MTLPDIDDIDTFGGALNDYSPVIDPTTDRPAAGANPAYADTAAMTRTLTRAWVRFTLNGSATPVIVAHDSNWGNAPAVAPTPVRTSAGLYTFTWPTVVQDEIPVGSPGYNSAGHTLNFRAAWAENHTGTVVLFEYAQPTAANVVTFRVFNTSFSAADPSSSTDYDIFVI